MAKKGVPATANSAAAKAQPVLAPPRNPPPVEPRPSSPAPIAPAPDSASVAPPQPPPFILTAYRYERGEGRVKHRWQHDYAGFLPSKRGPVGKCHRSISESEATRLLHSGVLPPFPDPPGLPPHPREIFNVYKGIPYVAVPTVPGRSYHGYPWSGRMSPTVRNELRVRAVKQGYERAFDQWLRTYGTR